MAFCTCFGVQYTSLWRAELFENKSGDLLSTCGPCQIAPCWTPKKTVKKSRVWRSAVSARADQCDQPRPCIDRTAHLFPYHAACYRTLNHLSLITSAWRWKMLRNGATSQKSANMCCLLLTAIRSYIPIHYHRTLAMRTTPLAKRQPIQPDTITSPSPY